MDNSAIFSNKNKKGQWSFPGPGCLFFEITRKKLNSQIRCIVLRVVQTSKEFWFFSINHLGGPLSKRMFTCDWCILIHFGCFCVARFDRPVSGNNRSVFYTDFSDLSYSYLTSASCPRQKFHSSSRFPSLFLSGLESFSVLSLRSKLGERGAQWFALTPPTLKCFGRNRKTYSKFANAQGDTTNSTVR